MTDPVDRLLAKLDNVTPLSTGGWTARCPAHEDRRNSLKIDRGDEDQHTIRDSARRSLLRKLWPKVPAALATLTRCATDPCHQREFGQAQEIVLRWLQISKACETHVMARRAAMRRDVVTRNREAPI